MHIFILTELKSLICQKISNKESCVIKMNIKKIAEDKFLLIIKKLGIEMEFNNDREAFQTGLELIGMK